MSKSSTRWLISITSIIALFIFGMGSVSAQLTPTLNISAGLGNYDGTPKYQTIAPSLTVSGGQISGAIVYIAEGFIQGDDYLGFNGSDNGNYSGTNINYFFDEITGVMTFTGTDSAANYQLVLSDLDFASWAKIDGIAKRKIVFTLGDALPFTDNGHFYQFISNGGITWHQAHAAAAASTYYGLQGYLTTVTSAQENAFIAAKLTGEGWMGASDDPATTNGAENDWYWVTGPEAGTLFCVDPGNNPSDAACVPQNGMYNNWAVQGDGHEPNNFDNLPESFGHFLRNPLLPGENGKWNDFKFDNNSIAGYVVEYGGMAGDPVINISDSVELIFIENAAPVLGTITTNSDYDEGATVSFTATATDPDGTTTFIYSLTNAPDGATIDANGNFSWTPSEAQGGQQFTFDVVVSDGNDTDTQTITITVNEVNNFQPVITSVDNPENANEGQLVTFTVSGIDGDGSQTLVYGLGNDAPDGMTIDPSTGVINWTPSEDQGGQTFTFTVTISDGFTTVEQQVTITVVEANNNSPVLDTITTDAHYDEAELVSFTATATDADSATTFTYSLNNAPDGAAIDANGNFSWTPSEAQGGQTFTFEVVVSDGTNTDVQEITITVDEVNNFQPVIGSVDNPSTVNEGDAVSFTVTGSDGDGSQTLVYGLGEDAPDGMTIDPATGVVNWTPSEDQGGQTFTFTVTVSDGFTTVDEQVTITVNEANTNTPVLGTINYATTVNEGQLVTFTATATDGDSSDTFTFGLTDAPAGATINASTGEFSWTPSEEQGAQTFTFYVTVSDGTNTGTPQQITIEVLEANNPPVLSAIGSQTVKKLNTLTFTAGATDSDAPSQTLTYALETNGVVGPTLDAAGQFNWVVDNTVVRGDYPMTITVTDSEGLSDSENFVVTVTLQDNLLVNGSFEVKDLNRPGRAANWKASQNLKNNRRCVTKGAPIAPDGNCVFSLVTNSGDKNSTVFQGVPLATANLQAGDQLILTAKFKSAGTARVGMRMIVTYSDNTRKRVGKIIPVNNVFRQFKLAVNLKKTPVRVKVIFVNYNSTRPVLIDSARLRAVFPVTRTSENSWLPLP